MANTIVSDVNNKEVWESNFTAEFVRQSGFLPYMGTAEGSIIRVRNRLMSEGGSLIHFPMVPKLSGNGITGSTVLRGNEEQLKNYSYAIRTALAANGVTVPESEAFKTQIDLLNAGKTALRNWAASRMRSKLIDQLQSVVVKGADSGDSTPGEDSNVVWGSATEANKDLFLDHNKDRILFPDTTNAKKRALATTAPAGGATNDMSATLATVTASDTLSAKVIGIAKRMAMNTTTGSSTAITPYKTDATQGREFYVLFVDANGFRDLSNDTAIAQANRDARPREVEQNPVFQDGDLLYQGVIIKCIPEIPTLGGVGASSAVLGTAFLCGAEALGVAYSKKPEARTDEYSYGMQKGVGIVMIDGFGKIAYNGVQNGVVTVVHASVAD